MARVSMGTVTSIAANATNANVMTGQIYERLPADELLWLGVTQSATGLLVDFLVGGVNMLQAFAPSLQNRTPQYPQDYPLRGTEGHENAQLILRVVNTTAGALSLFWLVELEEVPE